jgi:hypothetical protein
MQHGTAVASKGQYIFTIRKQCLFKLSFMINTSGSNRPWKELLRCRKGNGWAQT